jgi:hypothetical protein
VQFARETSYASITDAPALEALKATRAVEQAEKRKEGGERPAKRVKKGTPDEFAPPNKILFLQNLPGGVVGSNTLVAMFSQFEVCACGGE